MCVAQGGGGGHQNEPIAMIGRGRWGLPSGKLSLAPLPSTLHPLCPHAIVVVFHTFVPHSCSCRALEVALGELCTNLALDISIALKHEIIVTKEDIFDKVCRCMRWGVNPA